MRRLAEQLGLGGIAELPAAPCLSSRIETGIRIEAPMLAMVPRSRATDIGHAGTQNGSLPHPQEWHFHRAG